MSDKLKTRAEIPEIFHWHIHDLFATDDEWQQQFDDLKEELKAMDSFNGSLTIDTVFVCLAKRDVLAQKLDKLYVYANLRLNEDQTNPFYQGLSDKAESLIVSYQSQTSFIEPEILALDEQALCAKASDHLYKHYIEDLLRSKKHILSAPEENILAKVYELSVIPENVFSMMNNADMEFRSVADESGALTPLTHGKFIAMLESTDRRLRKDAFDAYYDAYFKQKNAIAATFNASIKKDVFLSGVRRYDNSLEAYLCGHNIPTTVYKNLIQTISEYLPLMHQYIRLRKQKLGVESLHMYDLYTPIVSDANIFINYDDAKASVTEALKPLGDAYGQILTEGLSAGWIDVYENKGKRSGAYAWGCHGCHPYVSLNYNDTINSMFTLAHEMGHAIHSHYSWATQPYTYSNYTIFVAEVASTVNEALLMQHLLSVTEDKTQKQYLYNYWLEQFRGTVFRQTMFAEFELLVHEMVEAGTPLTFDTLCEVYNGLNVKYYGPDIVLDTQISWEWARIPHFYNPYYVYQYATGYTAAIALSENILHNNGGAAYLQFLKSGSSDYSINLLKQAGVDMTTQEPIKHAMSVFKTILKQMECDPHA